MVNPHPQALKLILRKDLRFPKRRSLLCITRIVLQALLLLLFDAVDLYQPI